MKTGESGDWLPRLSFARPLESRGPRPPFGGTPDCSQCGCIASAGIKAVGDYRLLGFIPLRSLYNASDAVGKKTDELFNGSGAARLN